MCGKYVVDKLSRESLRLKVSARARASSRGIESAASAARPRLASSTPAPLSPITSSGPTTGFAATGRPDASASSSTRPKVSVNSGTRIRRRSRRRRQASRRAFRRRNALQESASEASSSPVRPQRRPLNPADLVTEKRQIFSIATRAQVRKIGLGNSKMLAARGRKRSQSTPCDQRIKRTNPRVSSSRPSVSVDTIMPEPALWNRRSRA